MGSLRIALLSSSVRMHRQSHKVAIALERNFSTLVKFDLIDLQEKNIPRLEFVATKHPNPPVDIVDIGLRIDAADGLIFLSPEYNGGYSSMLKNTVDYFSKTHYKRKPIGIVSVSAGALAGMRASLQMQHLSLALGGIPSPSMLLVPKVQDKFDENGNVKDEQLQSSIDRFIADYMWLANQLCK